MKGADPNSGPDKLSSPKEQYTVFKCLLQPRLSLVPNVTWTKPVHVFWLEAIPGSHCWVRSPDPCSGGSTFALPLGQCSTSVLQNCSAAPTNAGQEEMTMVLTSRLLCCSKARHKWRHSQMDRKIPQGQQIPKAKSSGGTLAQGWFIWFVGHQLFLQFISHCRV